MAEDLNDFPEFNGEDEFDEPDDQVYEEIPEEVDEEIALQEWEDLRDQQRYADELPERDYYEGDSPDY